MTEIERKFLVRSDAWRNEVTEVLPIRQGYLSTDKDCAVRVRRSGENAWLTIKGRPVNGAAPEFEYEIPVPEADAMLDTLAQKPLIEKKRHLVPHGGLPWEVDEFLGENTGLILAEIELTAPDQTIALPAWIGGEVTGNPRYYNANLVAAPFSTWAGE
ncbi:CYTH domain-containing protein [Desulfovibrio sp. OttesenSCG-928-O18]|nr:CYTH domain-containing protein [Desulfovibrio sp. OttesenSCG-928-O18]